MTVNKELNLLSLHNELLYHINSFGVSPQLGRVNYRLHQISTDDIEAKQLIDALLPYSENLSQPIYQKLIKNMGYYNFSRHFFAEDLKRRFDALHLNFPEGKAPDFSLQTPANIVLIFKIIEVGEIFHEILERLQPEDSQSIFSVPEAAQNILLVAKCIRETNRIEILDQLQQLNETQLACLLSYPEGLKVAINDCHITFDQLRQLDVYQLSYLLENPEGLKVAINELHITFDQLRQLNAHQLAYLLNNPEGLKVAINDCLITFNQLRQLDVYQLFDFLKNPEGLKVAINELHITFEQLRQLNDTQLSSLLNYPEGLKVAINDRLITFDQLRQLNCRRISSLLEYPEEFLKVEVKHH